MRFAVTTPLRPSPAEEAAAADAARRHGVAYAPRGNTGLGVVRSAAGVEALLVLSRTRSLLVIDGEAHPWSPGMGALRVKRLRDVAAGRAPPGGTRRDPFLEACALRPGDHVLDATLGLGADALVAAEAVGPGGRVIGVERAPALAAWVDEGLRRLDDPAASRVEVRAGDHAAVLAGLPTASVDVVVFDPMFRHARAEPGGFDVVRRLAEPAPIDSGSVSAARRVARRWVVVKDGAPGWDLARLGLTPLPSARGAERYYARITADWPGGEDPGSPGVR
ncbi:MAG: class I SAM-dependent methyltransferase [Anaeromyxobacteraceae bacterium]